MSTKTVNHPTNATVIVGSVAENNYRFTLGYKDVVIYGRHPASLKFQNHVHPYILTTISGSDWDAIKNKYRNSHVIKNGIIFAEKNEHETRAHAKDSGVQEIPRGTERLKTDPKTRQLSTPIGMEVKKETATDLGMMI